MSYQAIYLALSLIFSSSSSSVMSGYTYWSGSRKGSSRYHIEKQKRSKDTKFCYSELSLVKLIDLQCFNWFFRGPGTATHRSPTTSISPPYQHQKQEAKLNVCVFFFSTVYKIKITHTSAIVKYTYLTCSWYTTMVMSETG